MKPMRSSATKPMRRSAAKLMLGLALGALAAAALAAGCSVNHRSGDFACSTQADCASDRTCINGFCVVAADSGPVDAFHLPDAAVCPSQCTSCNLALKSCTIDCALQPGGCKQAVSCPTGFSCNVLCSQDGACNSGVDCAGSTSCTIACSGRQTCQTVTCGLGACGINCTGNGACNQVTCGMSCACEVSCRAVASCNDVVCKPGCFAAQGCSSTQVGCNTCR